MNEPSAEFKHVTHRMIETMLEHGHEKRDFVIECHPDLLASSMRKGEVGQIFGVPVYVNDLLPPNSLRCLLKAELPV